MKRCSCTEGEHRAGRPFFAYIASNTPHGPYHDVPEDLYRKYKQKDLSNVILSEDGEKDADTVARIFAMVENIDQNMGRLLAWLDELGLAETRSSSFSPTTDRTRCATWAICAA